MIYSARALSHPSSNEISRENTQTAVPHTLTTSPQVRPRSRARCDTRRSPQENRPDRIRSSFDATSFQRRPLAASTPRQPRTNREENARPR